MLRQLELHMMMISDDADKPEDSALAFRPRHEPAPIVHPTPSVLSPLASCALVVAEAMDIACKSLSEHA